MKVSVPSQFKQSKKAIALAAFAMFFPLGLADYFVGSYFSGSFSMMQHEVLAVLVTFVISAVFAWVAADKIIALNKTTEELASCEIQSNSHHAMMKAYYHYLVNTLKTLVSMIDAYTSKGRVDKQLIESAKALAVEIKNDLDALSKLENPTKDDIYDFLRNHHF